MTYVLVTSLVTVAMVIVTVLQTTLLGNMYPLATSVVAMVGNAVSDANWVIVSLFSAELYPTVMRFVLLLS